MSEAVTLWKESVVNTNVDENNNGQQPTVKTVQANWDTPIYEKIYQDLLDKQSTPAEKARLRAVASDQASAWLNATPMSSIGLKLDNSSVRVAVGLRLGTKLCEPHKCICGQLVDPWGRHGLSCRNAKGTNSRHAHANSLIKRALASAGTPSVLEPPGLSRTDFKRPDGLTLFPWSGGKNAVWDFTCRDTLCLSNVGETSLEAGKAAQQGESSKFNTYRELSTNYTVIPVAVETMGTWGHRTF